MSIFSDLVSHANAAGCCAFLLPSHTTIGAACFIPRRRITYRLQRPADKQLSSLRRYTRRTLNRLGVTMLVMPANNKTNALKMERVRKNSAGLLIGPDAWIDPGLLPWATDNGMYGAWSRAGYPLCQRTGPKAIRDEWNRKHKADANHILWERAYLLMLAGRGPLFVLAEDCPGNPVETIKLARVFADTVLSCYGFPAAIAVQDGMTPDDVPAGWTAFIGGTTVWKWRNVQLFARHCRRVHVGRVNSERRLWQCLDAGVYSVDGTGWNMGDRKQWEGLERFLRRQRIAETKTLF